MVMLLLLFVQGCWYARLLQGQIVIHRNWIHHHKTSSQGANLYNNKDKSFSGDYPQSVVLNSSAKASTGCQTGSPDFA